MDYIPQIFTTLPNHSTYLNQKNRYIIKRANHGFVYMFFGVLKKSKHCVLKVGFTKSFPVTKLGGYSRINSHFKNDFSDIYVIDIFDMGIDKERRFHKYCSSQRPNTCENCVYRQTGSVKSLIREIYRVDCFTEIYAILNAVYNETK